MLLSDKLYFYNVKVGLKNLLTENFLGILIVIVDGCQFWLYLPLKIVECQFQVIVPLGQADLVDRGVKWAAIQVRL